MAELCPEAFDIPVVLGRRPRRPVATPTDVVVARDIAKADTLSSTVASAACPICLTG